MSLRNRVALVTGGSRGIGRGVATRLAKDGARVAIAYRSNKAAAQQTLRTLQSAALDKVALIRDQNFAHVLGMIHYIHVLARDFEIHQVAVLARSLAQEAERVRAEGVQVPDDGRILRTWGSGSFDWESDPI